MTETCEAPNVISAKYFETLPMPSRHIHDQVELEFGHINTLIFVEVVLNLINHLCLFFMTVGIFYKCMQLKFQRTAMHASLCTLGMIFMMAEAMMIRYQSNPVFHHLELETKCLIHILLLVAGGILTIYGTIHKMLLKSMHFNTPHGRFGLAACLLWMVNVGLGIVNVNSDYLSVEFVPLIVKIVHSFVGLLTFFMAVFAQYCSFSSGFFRRNFPNVELYKNMLMIIMICTALGPIEICVENYIAYKNTQE